MPFSQVKKVEELKEKVSKTETAACVWSWMLPQDDEAASGRLFCCCFKSGCQQLLHDDRGLVLFPVSTCCGRVWRMISNRGGGGSRVDRRRLLRLKTWKIWLKCKLSALRPPQPVPGTLTRLSLPYYQWTLLFNLNSVKRTNNFYFILKYVPMSFLTKLSFNQLGKLLLDFLLFLPPDAFMTNGFTQAKIKKK